MVEWCRYSTRVYKILHSNLGIIIHGMALDKSFTAKLSRTTHSYRVHISSVSTLDGRSADSVLRDGHFLVTITVNHEKQIIFTEFQRNFCTV